MKYQFYTLDVFTDQIFGGNPLAVFTDGQGLSSEQMQRVAREFNLSETVFVLPPEQPEHSRKLRIFTPEAELPFAGHPTVGTAYLLAALGEIPLSGERTQIIFEEGAGPVPVSIFAEGGQPVSAQLTTAQLPQFGPPPPAAAELAGLLSLDPDDLIAEEIQAVSCGLPFLLVPIRRRQAMGRIQLKRERWEQLLAGYWTPHIYVFTDDLEAPGLDFRVRMFAPALGIAEDPATGAAAAAFAGYLGVRDQAREGLLRWRIEQGIEMGRPSLLEIEAEKREGQITAVRVGGRAVLVSEGKMNLDLA
jgi:trans-2,3-dihydro-3-hydroxyanthranilate isomerase